MGGSIYLLNVWRIHNVTISLSLIKYLQHYPQNLHCQLFFDTLQLMIWSLLWSKNRWKKSQFSGVSSIFLVIFGSTWKTARKMPVVTWVYEMVGFMKKMRNPPLSFRTWSNQQELPKSLTMEVVSFETMWLSANILRFCRDYEIDPDLLQYALSLESTNLHWGIEKRRMLMTSSWKSSSFLVSVRRYDGEVSQIHAEKNLQKHAATRIHWSMW